MKGFSTRYCHNTTVFFEYYRSYGKFAQSVVRNNNQIEYLTDPEELRKLIKSPNVRINYCHLINVSKNFATFIIG